MCVNYFAGAFGALVITRKVSMVITPTVGRVVWYTPTENDGMSKHGGQPFAAHVVFVHNDRLVNLVVFDHDGRAHQRGSVQLSQEGDSVPSIGGYAEWMPYQVGQAKKHEGQKNSG